MSSNVKKVIYWSMYVLLLLIGICIKMTNMLPIKTTSVFMFSIMWIWSGVSLICQINPYYAQKYERKYQFVFAMTSLGLGIAWGSISLTHLSARAIPMILISTPFVIIDLIMFLRYKKS